VVLRAETGELVAADELLRRAWDLDSLASDYDEFVATFKTRSARSNEARFAALVDLVHAWRRFPFVDPEIPARLLPSQWPGRKAKELFDTRHEAWGAGANAWYDEREESSTTT
jgi:phenylacetic acid degradation operon negative regulatory protein